MRYQVWPMAQIDGEWSVPDEMLSGLWAQLVQTGKAWQLFYNGGVRTLADWFAWMKSPANVPILIVDSRDKKISCVSWINNVSEGAAQIHQCMFGLPNPEIGEMGVAYFCQFPGLAVLIGITPEHYTTAIRFAKRIGFQEVGTVPNMLNMAYEKRRVGAVITHYQVPGR